MTIAVLWSRIPQPLEQVCPTNASAIQHRIRAKPSTFDTAARRSPKLYGSMENGGRDGFRLGEIWIEVSIGLLRKFTAKPFCRLNTYTPFIQAAINLSSGTR